MSMTFKAGDATIHRIVEMECGFTPALEFLPNLTQGECWTRTAPGWRPPRWTRRTIWCCASRSYVIQTGGRNILVDSCIGNDKERTARPLWNKKKDDAFMSGLARAGLTVNDIDFVMCTHLHVDHIGWNTRLENGRWVPTFPKARYIFSKTELDFWVEENRKSPLPPIEDSVIPIVEAKMCDLVTSDHSLTDMIALIPTPGHTIDHYAVTLGRNGRDAVFTGDLIHTPLQARYPDLTMRVDYDPQQGAASRRRFLETYCDTDTLCCFAHFPSPSKGYVKRWGDGFKCDYVG